MTTVDTTPYTATYELDLACGETVLWVGEFAHLPVSYFRCPCGSPMACEVLYRRESDHTHVGVAGAMYVNDEDLDTVSALRAVICEGCDALYSNVHGWQAQR